MEKEFKNFKISDDKNLIDVTATHSLLKSAYWCKGIPREKVAAAITHSLCVGVYKDSKQIAYARVVTDQTTFAWICDVIVDENFRGQGISKAMIGFLIKHPQLQGLRRICLATKDAHKLYERFGFKVTEAPQNWMEIKNNDIYLK